MALPLDGFLEDERGVSTQIGYVLSAAVAALLISVLISSTTGLVQNQQESAARHELKVTGERLATQLQAADRIADDDPSAVVVMNAEPPRVAAGDGYTVTLSSEGETIPSGNPELYVLILETDDGKTTVEVPVHLESTVEENSVSGGKIDIVHEGGSLTIEAHES